MPGESSPDPLQEPDPNHLLKSNTPNDDSISGVGSQQSLLRQLQSSQSATACALQDEKNNSRRVVQSDNSEYKQILETNESFFFAPQPKHKPNQFSGRQKHLNIDFETFEAPKGDAEGLVVDTPPSGPVTPRQCWEQNSPKDSRDYHRKTARSQIGNSSNNIRQEKQNRSITDDRDLNSLQPDLEHHTSGVMNPPFEKHTAVETASESRRNSIDQRPGFTREGRHNGRPFSDADASFPVFNQTPAQKPGQSPVVDKGNISCLNAPRGTIDSIAKPVHASDQRKETMVSVKTPQAHNGNTFEKAKREQQFHTPRYNKQHLRGNVCRSPSKDGTVLLNNSRFGLSETRKNGDIFLDVHFLSSQMFQNIDSRVVFKNDTIHVQKSHFDVFQSMITHHNMFLEDAKLTEESLRNEIAGQGRTIEDLKTRMERSYLRHQQEQEHQKTLDAEISSLLREKDEVIATMAQRDGREQELGAEVAKLRALGEGHTAETSELKRKLEEAQSKLERLKDKGHGYKDHLNKAIAEHQGLWLQSRNISQKAINDMRKEQHQSQEHFRLALEDKQAAQDKLNRISNDKNAVLQKELHAAASKTKSLESAMEKIKSDLLAESDKTKGLEEQLSKSRERETILLRVEDNIKQVSDTLNEVHAKSEQANVVPTNILERLDKIATYVQSALWADLGNEIRQALNNFQKEIVPQFLQEVKTMTTGRSTIEDRLQSLEKTVQDQAVLAQIERQKQQEQLLQQISEDKKESHHIFLDLKSKNDQMTEIFKAVSELANKLQELKASAGLASQKETTLEAETWVLQELLLSREHQVSEIQAELKLQREAHEVTLRELRERLLQAEEDVRQKSELVEGSRCKTLAEDNGFAAKAQEKKRDLELQLRHSEDSRQNIQQQLSKSEAEIKRLKILEDNSEVLTLRKELDDANQRIVNLTLKLRETQMPAVGAGVLDQLAEQLAHLDNMKEDIRQLKTSGKTYTTVSKELETMIYKHDTALGDDILAPDNLVVPEPDLPDLQRGDPVNPQTVQSGKKTVFRRPVEESYQEVAVPSVAQEKLHRREVKSHGPPLRPILRQQRMATGPLNASGELLVTRHAGHSSYNRPVQGAPMTGRTAISDVRSNLLGNCKAQKPHLTRQSDWKRMTAQETQGVRQGTKRSNGLSPSSQGLKRSKTSFPVDNGYNNNVSSVPGEQGIVSSKQIESSQQTDIDSTGSSQGQSQDNDHTSRHFHQSMHKPSADLICRGNVEDGIDSQQK
ncbi:hypothetical protein LX36DRAFT_687510 [Colletotrichum falcatum]|nr:hypothetical protein LX36DRAFT_687510 [Colletotrichum falcatum]